MLPIALILAAASLDAHAWARRGHAIVCETAAYLLAPEKRAFLKAQSFDLAYYCNVPDLVWKSTNYDEEHPQHFIDLEIYDKLAPEKDWSEDRHAFFAKHADIKLQAGRAPWRISEFHASALELAKKLKAFSGPPKERKELQLKWLTKAGTLGHYIGDLSQPLHVTESHDGQATGQKGIHAFFEADVVDELGPGLEAEVFKRAQEVWKAAPACDLPLPCAIALARDSATHIKELLEIDKKTGRASLPKAAKAYHALIVERLAAGAIALAALWRKESDFDFDSEKFWNFEPRPPFPPAPQ